MSQGAIPSGATLVDNAPNEDDPQSMTFRWVPKHGQECTYQVCFLAKNTRDDGFPIDYSYTIATNPHVDERCFTVVVARAALALGGSSWMDAPAAVPAAMRASCGATVAMWFKPVASATSSMPLASLSVVNGGVTTVWQQLTWHTSTGGKRWALRLTDTSGGGAGVSVTTDEIACVGEWHFVVFTVEASTKKATIYLDGTAATHVTPESRNFHPSVGQATLMLTNLPGDAGGGNAAALRFGGSGFSGEVAGARAYKRQLAADEVMGAMASPPAGDAFGLLAYYGFGDGAQGSSAAGGFNRYAAVAVGSGTTGDTTGSGTGDSPLTPSAMEMSAVGKSVGNAAVGGVNGAAVSASGTAHFVFSNSPDAVACPSAVSPTTVHSDSAAEVTVTGSGFAKSSFLACHFSNPNPGGDDGGDGAEATRVRATWVSDTEVRCKAPRVAYATVAAVEIANLPDAASAQRVPLYMLQQALSLRTATDVATLSGICGSITNATKAFTFSAWIKPESSKEGTALKVVGDNRVMNVVYGGAAERFEIRTVAAGIKATVAVSALAPYAGSGQPKSGWHFVVATLGADGAVSLSVDGAEPVVGTASFGAAGLAPAPNGGTCAVTLGGAVDDAAAAQGNGLSAMLEDVKFWTKPLTSCETYGVMWNTQINPENCPAGARVAITESPSDGLLAHFSFDGGVVAGQGPTGTTYAASIAGNAKAGKG